MTAPQPAEVQCFVGWERPGIRRTVANRLLRGRANPSLERAVQEHGNSIRAGGENRPEWPYRKGNQKARRRPGGQARSARPLRRRPSLARTEIGKSHPSGWWWTQSEANRSPTWVRCLQGKNKECSRFSNAPANLSRHSVCDLKCLQLNCLPIITGKRSLPIRESAVVSRKGPKTGRLFWAVQASAGPLSVSPPIPNTREPLSVSSISSGRDHEMRAHRQAYDASPRPPSRTKPGISWLRLLEIA